MRTRYTKFVTEHGATVEVDTTLEVANHLTGEIVIAGEAPPDEAVIIPARWTGTVHDVLAIRDTPSKRSA